VSQGFEGPNRESSATFMFSGRVFIYTLNALTSAQIADLVKWYQAKGLALEIRGAEYWVMHRMPAQPSKDSK
jgi:hypothetical protein